MTPRIEHAVDEPYKVLQKNEHTTITQEMKMNKTITLDKVALAPRPAWVTPVTPESPSEMENQNKSLNETPWLFQQILDHHIKDSGQLIWVLWI